MYMYIMYVCVESIHASYPRMKPPSRLGWRGVDYSQGIGRCCRLRPVQLEGPLPQRRAHSHTKQIWLVGFALRRATRSPA